MEYYPLFKWAVQHYDVSGVISIDTPDFATPKHHCHYVFDLICSTQVFVYVISDCDLGKLKPHLIPFQLDTLEHFILR